MQVNHMEIKLYRTDHLSATTRKIFNDYIVNTDKAECNIFQTFLKSSRYVYKFQTGLCSSSAANVRKLHPKLAYIFCSIESDIFRCSSSGRKGFCKKPLNPCESSLSSISF